MFSILLSIPRFHRRKCRCALLPAVAKKVPLIIFPLWQSLKCTRTEQVTGLCWVSEERVYQYLQLNGGHFAISVWYRMLIWQQTSWNIHQNLIKLIYTIIYRFNFTKTLCKNWISWHIIRFNEISVMLCNQPMDSYLLSIQHWPMLFLVPVQRLGKTTSF